MKITVMCSDKNHKIFPHLEKWVQKNKRNHSILLVTKSKNISKGDILFLVSCTEFIGKTIRGNFKETLVIHESDLPKGRGWSPLMWQILEGKKRIPISLLDAAEKIDSGDIWKKEFVKLEGHETANEINQKIFPKKLKLMDFAIKNFGKIKKIPQKGKPTYYSQRKPEDNKLNVNKTIKDQFDLMRTADNERYPCYFDLMGNRYKISISKIK